MGSTDTLELTYLYSYFWSKFEIFMDTLAFCEPYIWVQDIPYLHAPLSNFSEPDGGREYNKEDFCICCGEYLLWAKVFCPDCIFEGIL